jgi:DNA repair exonuclease SbcCD ATPase subunit
MHPASVSSGATATAGSSGDKSSKRMKLRSSEYETFVNSAIQQLRQSMELDDTNVSSTIKTNIDAALKSTNTGDVVGKRVLSTRFAMGRDDATYLSCGLGILAVNEDSPVATGNRSMYDASDPSYVQGHLINLLTEKLQDQKHNCSENLKPLFKNVKHLLKSKAIAEAVLQQMQTTSLAGISLTTDRLIGLCESEASASETTDEWNCETEDYATVSAMILALINVVSEREDIFDDLYRALNKEEDENSKLQAEVNELTTINTKAQADIQTLALRVEELITAYGEFKTSANTEDEKKSTEIQILTGQLRNAQEQFEAVERLYNEEVGKLSAAQTELAETKRANEAETNDLWFNILECNTEKENLTAQKTLLEEQLRASQSDCEALTEQVTSLDEENAQKLQEAQAQVSSLKRSIKENEKNYAEATAKLSVLQVQLENAERNSKETIAGLQSELETCNEEKETLEGQKTDLSKQLIELEQKHAALDKQNKEENAEALKNVKSEEAKKVSLQ